MIKIKEIILYIIVSVGFLVSGSFLQDIPVSNIQPTESWIPLALMAGSMIYGAVQKKQARDLETQNVRPVYKPSSELALNQSLARDMSKVGLPDQVYNNQLDQIQQGMATGLRTAMSRRGTLPINVNSLVRSNNRAVGDLNAQDARARQQGLQLLMGANKDVASDSRYAYNVNELDPWKFNAQNISSLRRAGNQNIFGGLAMIGQGYASGMLGDNMGLGSNAFSGLGSNIGITNFRSGFQLG